MGISLNFIMINWLEGISVLGIYHFYPWNLLYITQQHWLLRKWKLRIRRGWWTGGLRGGIPKARWQNLGQILFQVCNEGNGLPLINSFLIPQLFRSDMCNSRWRFTFSKDRTLSRSTERSEIYLNLTRFLLQPRNISQTQICLPLQAKIEVPRKQRSPLICEETVMRQLWQLNLNLPPSQSLRKADHKNHFYSVGITNFLQALSCASELSLNPLDLSLSCRISSILFVFIRPCGFPKITGWGGASVQGAIMKTTPIVPGCRQCLCRSGCQSILPTSLPHSPPIPWFPAWIWRWAAIWNPPWPTRTPKKPLQTIEHHHQSQNSCGTWATQGPQELLLSQHSAPVVASKLSSRVGPSRAHCNSQNVRGPGHDFL